MAHTSAAATLPASEQLGAGATSTTTSTTAGKSAPAAPATTAGKSAPAAPATTAGKSAPAAPSTTAGTTTKSSPGVTGTSATATSTLSASGAVTTSAAARPTTTAVAISKAQKPSEGFSPSGPAIALVVIAALLALGAILWGIARWRAWEPHWALSLRHALAEAGYHASLTWAEVSDWARLGR
jgi:hypothetical protein